jgi:hypothetical protein
MISTPFFPSQATGGIDPGAALNFGSNSPSQTAIENYLDKNAKLPTFNETIPHDMKYSKLRNNRDDPKFNFKFKLISKIISK